MNTPQKSSSANENARPKRPYFLKLMVFLFLVLAWLGWLRFYNALELWRMLDTIGLSVSPFYLAASGVFWGLTGLACALWLSFGWRYAAWVARLGALAAAALYWVDDLWLADPSATHANRPFAIALTLILLAFVFSALELRQVKAFLSVSKTR